ncbi:unnamed protein product [Brachionus calyciflorus]|uniref:G-protein coupled receptors family 1 profile domain-containing protein n=1 Tax=Brachionus calyciflorus TaxID=104777 RepID=A0A813V0C1_9BILA|nr:unnamed protein product [Brachionus calyciflorus]
MDDFNSGPMVSTTSTLYHYDDMNYESSSELKSDVFEPKSPEILIHPSSSPINELTNNSNSYELLLNEQENDESNAFRALIVCLGLFIISIGILSNLLFSLLIICRKRKRKTASTLIMSSMSLAYILFFIFYCFKISVYFNLETIIKFHIYDITENWTLGSFMCKFISSLPICCKLLTRLSLLTMVIMRILGFLIRNNCVSNSKAYHDKNVNILKDNRSNIQKLNLIKKFFECPLLLIIILLIWLISLFSTWPIFASYKLNDALSPPICDSTYDFPNEIQLVSKLFFNYFIYGLVVPVFLTIIALIFLSVIQKGKNASSSNCLLWVLIVLHLLTSVPQESYRYIHLTQTNFEDPNHLELTFNNPLIFARPYYSMQLLYISEFALIPLVFLIFLTCSSKLVRDVDTNKKGRIRNFLSLCFYDYNLIGVVDDRNSDKNVFNNTTDQSLNDALLDHSQGNESKNTPNHEIPIEKTTEYFNNNQNVLHIIQHPSWRINIKQQPNTSSKNGSVQLPFNYMNSNM